MPVKLRKSCDACSETKLGCSREHPRCARCAKRGLDCVYGVAKRAGRTCGSSRSKTNNPTSTLTGCPSPRSTTAHMETTATPPVEGIQSTMDLHTDQDQFSPSFQEMLAAMNSVAETSHTSMQPSQFLDLDELMASAMPLDNPTDFDAFGTGQSPQFSLDLAGSSDYSISSHSNFGKFGSFGSSNNFFATSGEARSTQAGMTTPVSSHGGSVLGRSSLEDAAISKNIPVDLHTASLDGINRDATDKTFPTRRPCECLTRSLTLLSQLPPDPPSGSILDEDFDISMNMLDVDQVIAQNKKTSEIIRAILKCSCASDGYLLVILSLAVFKMLTWYSAAAAYAASGRRQSRMVSSADWSNQNTDAMDVVLQAPSNFVNDFDCEGEEQQRIVCQQVLSKLHDVQLTVVALSEHLLKIGGSGAKSNTTGKSPCQAASARIRVPGGNAHGLPLSRELAQTLEADMRKRLSASSKAIVERLRRR